mgnify:CR=1 FL=1
MVVLAPRVPNLHRAYRTRVPDRSGVAPDLDAADEEEAINVLGAAPVMCRQVNGCACAARSELAPRVPNARPGPIERRGNEASTLGTTLNEVFNFA